MSTPLQEGRSPRRPTIRLRSRLRRVTRWYALACARGDAHHLGFVVADHLEPDDRLDTYPDPR